MIKSFINFILETLSGLGKVIFTAGKLTIKKIDQFITNLNLPIRTKLLVFFIIVVIPSLIFTYLSFSVVRKTLSSQIDSYHKSVVSGATKNVERYVLNCVKRLSSLGGTDKNFRSMVKNEKSYALNKKLEEVFVKFKDFSFLGVVKKNSAGELYFLSNWPKNYRRIIQNDEVDEFLKWNFSNPSVGISKVVKYRDNPETFIVYPLPGALLIGGVDSRKIFSLLDKVKPLRESEFILLDKNKNYILGGAGKFTESLDKPGGRILLSAGKKVMYYDYTKITNVDDWTIGLRSPLEVVYRSLNSLKKLFYIFIAAALIFAFLLSFYFSHRVTSPIQKLNKGAQILGGGNLNYRIDLKTGDELEQLAQEFNNMAGELKKSYDSMGDKIKAATRDLQDAYKEIEQKNKELKKVDKLKSEFLASMSHELRTPINAIIGFTSLMEEGTYGDISDKQQKTLEKIMTNTEHLLDLINDILDLSKIEAGKLTLNFEKFKVNRLLKEIQESMKPIAEKKGLKFELITPDVIECYLDYTRVRQIVTNLVSNAIKFTKQGEVKIRTESREENFLIEVEDTGIGIKEEQQQKLFDEFIQADGSITREFGGTGLGLSISKKLVRMMEGKIELESQWKKGSTFRVILPYEINKEGEEIDEYTTS
ncbi:MAG: ATP-binding protein [Elusimicrobiota bacterium]